MNHIGTHDTARALTVLGGEPGNGRGRDWQHCQKLNQYQKERGKKLLKLASLIQYTLPGVPPYTTVTRPEPRGTATPLTEAVTLGTERTASFWNGTGNLEN